MKKLYTCYELESGNVKLRVKVAPNKITLINQYRQYKHNFEFTKSSPETIKSFANVMNQAVKLSKEATNATQKS